MKLRKTTSLFLALSLTAMGALSPQALKAEAAPKPGTSSGINVSYQTHVQNAGWKEVVKDGAISGTVGNGLRMEGIKINITNEGDLGIAYNTHVQELGWGNSYVSNGQLSGTEGRALRLEAISIKLTGTMARNYDIYYRVHSQDHGWLDWAKNGEYAGTEGQSRRLEAIEIVLVKQGEAAPGSTAKPFIGPNK